MEYLDTLNNPQKEAVTNINGPMLVIAGAGSGKTRVLTMRIAYLLEHGVKPYNILALTFTNKAAREMKERIANIVGTEVASHLWMGTFHSIFAKILRYEAQNLGFTSDFTIFDAQDSKSLIKKIIKARNLDDKIYKPSNVQNAISMAKNELISPTTYANSDNYIARDKQAKRPLTAQIYAEYVRECRKCNALDFDDLLLYTNVLFRDHSDVLAKYQDKFKYLLVDEYQDTNFSQYVIIKRLVAQNHNICVVGDDAQSIYSFRGARIENILSFNKDYPEMKLYKLEQNYRSTQNIVNAANSLISRNQGQIKKTVFSENDEGEKVHVTSAYSDNEEAEMVCNDIHKRMIYEHLQPSDFAILYRTNAQSRTFEENLRKMNVRYKIYGGLAFYQRKEIKDVLAYFRLSLNHNDDESFRRIINYPTRSIGLTTLQKIEQIASVYNISLWEAIEPQRLSAAGFNQSTISKISNFASLISTFGIQATQLDVYQYAAEVVSQSGIMKDLTENKNDLDGKERFENINGLMSGIKEFSDRQQETGEDATLRTYLEEVALISDLDNDHNDEHDHITLMTIHSSKGLEFSNIYIVGAEDEIFPGQQSASNPIAIEEERRLFYVALTRAKRSATISYALSRFYNGNRQQGHPSRFIADIESCFVDRPTSMNVEHPNINTLFSYNSRSEFSNRYKFQNTSQRSHSSSFRRVAQASQISEPSNAQSTTTNTGKQYSVGDRVVHETFGRGTILAIEGAGQSTKLRIEFEHVGIKHLLLKFARLKAL